MPITPGEHLFDLMQQNFDEDAEQTRPRPSTLFSAAGPSALALDQQRLDQWKKAKLAEQQRRQMLLDRWLRPGSAALADIIHGGSR